MFPFILHLIFHFLFNFQFFLCGGTINRVARSKNNPRLLLHQPPPPQYNRPSVFNSPQGPFPLTSSYFLPPSEYLSVVYPISFLATEKHKKSRYRLSHRTLINNNTASLIPFIHPNYRQSAESSFCQLHVTYHSLLHNNSAEKSKHFYTPGEQLPYCGSADGYLKILNPEIVSTKFSLIDLI